MAFRGEKSRPGRTQRARPLIAHVIFRFAVGGLENGVVNLINHMPADRFDHVVICLESCDRDFARRLKRSDVEIHEIGKSSGKDVLAYWRLWRLLRRLRPEVAHSRNLGTLDCVLIAALAGVPVRIHGEHGWDVTDQYGASRKYRRLRIVMDRFVHHYVAVSSHLARWLSREMGVDAGKISNIHNGVDSARFHPADTAQRDCGEVFVIGAVCRFATVKDPLNLVEAFIRLLRQRPEYESRARLVMLGDGELHAVARARLREAGYQACADLPGAVNDVAQRMRRFDLFVLPSLMEGISNTLLEAMACGLPVVATQVGGNIELVKDGQTGTLVSSGDSSVLAEALLRYLLEPELGRGQGEAGRTRVESGFGIKSMVDGYMDIYQRLLAAHSLDKWPLDRRHSG